MDLVDAPGLIIAALAYHLAPKCPVRGDAGKRSAVSPPHATKISRPTS